MVLSFAEELETHLDTKYYSFQNNSFPYLDLAFSHLDPAFFHFCVETVQVDCYIICVVLQ